MSNKKSKNRLHRLELLGAISFVLVLLGIFMINQMDFSLLGQRSNLVTGFVSSDTLTQEMNLMVTESQVYDLTAENAMKMTSLRLTGLVEGQGIVQVFFEDATGQQLLVYSNIREKKAGNLITGMAAAGGLAVRESEKTSAPNVALAADEIIVSGSFYNECHNTCFMSAPLSQGSGFKLIFKIGPETKVKVSQISYTI